MYLLDVNVLIALTDPLHLNHDDAHGWFSQNDYQGWATCPLTENAFVRILSNPSYPNLSLRPAEAAKHLKSMIENKYHYFISDDTSILDDKIFDLNFLTGSKQTTDIFLLGLAYQHKLKLVTFDRKIPYKAVQYNQEAILEIL